MGMTYLAMGRITKAVTAFENAVNASPQVPEFHFALARAYTLSGNYQKARNSYNQVIYLSPGSPLAREAKMEAERIGG